jgi:hypothetical protein
MNEEARYKLNKLQRKYLLYRYSEIVLQSAGIFLLAYSILDWFQIETQSIKIFISLLSGFSLLIILSLYNRLHLLNQHSFTQYLNEKFPSLNESADLMLFNESELTSLQQLQRIKMIEQFNLIYSSVKLPHHLVRSSIILLISFAVYFVASSFSNSRKEKSSNSIPVEKLKVLNKGVQSISIRSLSIAINPPAYMGLKSSASNGLDLQFAEGSSIRWQIEFSGKPKEVKFIFSGKDSINTNEKNYTIEKKFFESGFYQIQWSDSNMIHRSDYYQLEVIKDQSPKVELKSLQQFTKLKYADLTPLSVSSVISDDYGVSDAILIATVSKGSGESVKFREEKLRFTSPSKISGKNLIASRSLDFKKLGLEPGDELYFYAEAWDNKFPSPNYSRTETFFIAVQDTATEINSVDSGFGVDLMPEYFRSQRQIIIDTEKLLRDKKRISKLEFNSTSNELGYDQKVLRLRYGQFLGEEDEGGIGQEAVQHDEEEKDVTKQFGHTHDTKNEHNLVPQKKESHDHGDELKNPDEKEDPIKAFAHSHDNYEESTFFIQSLKTKLKAAVTIMWDAELYLRLYEPEKSLPYQYKALNLLKEISNDSRVYVHRTGFDPPPLKEEKRLTADLSEVKTNTNSNQVNSEQDYPAIRRALIVVEELLTGDTYALSNKNRIALSKAGQELSSAAIDKPLIYLKSLSLLKSLSDGQVSNDQMHDALFQIRKSFWTVLSHQPSSPNKQSSSSTKLDKEFLRSFEKIRNE